MSAVEKSDLEAPIRDLMHMANITRSLAIEVIGGVGEQKDGMRLLCIDEDQHERLLFAISKTADMAVELNEAFYHKG
jgi:hypothetical protein